mmetsp:Transcript_4684/g.7977  ORF Transcript_4684/g.7977 Transcript_4684/m.7977 type:complete len:310 (+) Transcript_4684:589-1518(+)
MALLRQPPRPSRLYHQLLVGIKNQPRPHRDSGEAARDRLGHQFGIATGDSIEPKAGDVHLRVLCELLGRHGEGEGVFWVPEPRAGQGEVVVPEVFVNLGLIEEREGGVLAVEADGAVVGEEPRRFAPLRCDHVVERVGRRGHHCLHPLRDVACRVGWGEQEPILRVSEGAIHPLLSGHAADHLRHKQIDLLRKRHIRRVSLQHLDGPVWHPGLHYRLPRQLSNNRVRLDCVHLARSGVGRGDGENRERPGADIHHAQPALLPFQPLLDGLDELWRARGVVSHRLVRFDGELGARGGCLRHPCGVKFRHL